MARDEYRFSREMGYTHSEFLRTLETFMGDAPYTVADRKINIPGNGRSVGMMLADQQERKIGPTMKLTFTPVEFVFVGYPEADRKLFLERFELIFRKGGG